MNGWGSGMVWGAGEAGEGGGGGGRGWLFGGGGDKWIIEVVYRQTHWNHYLALVCAAQHYQDKTLRYFNGLQQSICFPQVFIHDDALHIIPIPSTPGEVTALPIGTPSVSQAIGLVCGSMKTTASEKVQQALESRIRG